MRFCCSTLETRGYSNATFEHIAGDIIRGASAASWDTDEGGQVPGGASLKEDTRSATLGGLVKAFDTGTFERTRSHGNAEESIPDNPAASTIAQKEKKKRKRHTQEGLKAIRDASPQWLKNAIDLALLTASRRGDVLEMRFDKIEEGFLSVIQEKTPEEIDTAWIKYELTPELLKVIEQCWDEVDSPFLVHRKPERMHAIEHKEHWSKVERRYLTRAFQGAREAAGCYAGGQKKNCLVFMKFELCLSSSTPDQARMLRKLLVTPHQK